MTLDRRPATADNVAQLRQLLETALARISQLEELLPTITPR